jgi:hypothetical protein
MFNIETLAADLGLDPKTLKPEVAAKWNGYLSEADKQYKEAQKLKADAEALQQVIDQNIAGFGVTEANNIQLQAQVEALKAAQKTLEEKYGTKIDLKLPEVGKPAQADPVKSLESLIVQGFTNINQAQAANNRYLALYGKPMPDDPSALADEAAAHRMSVSQWADQKYGFAKKQKELDEAAFNAKVKAAADAEIAKYKEANPYTAGNPELNGGMPSNHPLMPKPMEIGKQKEFSGMSAREKVAAMVGRAQERLSQATT